MRTLWNEYIIIITNPLLSTASASCLLAASIAAVPRVRRDSTPDNYELPSNASVVVGGISYGFEWANST